MSPGVGSILAGYRLLGWLFPAQQLTELTTASYEQLCLKYKNRDFWGNLLGFLFSGVMVAVYFMAMLVMGNWIASDVPKERFFGPFEFLYLVAAFFLSLFSSGYLLFGIYRLVLGKREYDLYMAYGGEKIRRSAIGVPLHFGKAFGMFFVLFMPPLVLFMAAYMDTYTSFTEQKIVLNPFWSYGQRMTRPYSDVQGVYEVMNIHLRDKDQFEPYQVIVFKDGTHWETDHGSLDPKLQRQRDLIAFVARKSVKPIRVVDFMEDIPH